MPKKTVTPLFATNTIIFSIKELISLYLIYYFFKEILTRKSEGTSVEAKFTQRKRTKRSDSVIFMTLLRNTLEIVCGIECQKTQHVRLKGGFPGVFTTQETSTVQANLPTQNRPLLTFWIRNHSPSKGMEDKEQCNGE